MMRLLPLLLTLTGAACGPHGAHYAIVPPAPYYVSTRSIQIPPTLVTNIIQTFCQAVQQQKAPVVAIVIFSGSIAGTIRLTQSVLPAGPTTIRGTITGLTPGAHGFHIHQTGNLSTGCTSTGGHYNPFNQNHGAPTASIRHVGDLGNIVADASGTAVVTIQDRQVTLVGPNSVIGRAVVVHAGRDDLGLGGDSGSLATGNAGARVGCGVIGRA